MRKLKRGISLFLVLVMTSLLFFEYFPGISYVVNAADRTWDFSKSVSEWKYDYSWAGNSYAGKGSLEYDSGKKMAKLALDYSHNISNGWSQTGMSFTDSEGIDYSGSKVLNIELYYNPKDYKEGDITVKVDSQDVFQEQMSAILGGKGVKQKNGMMQVDLSFEINSQYAKTEKPQTLMVVFAGNNTDFKGNIYIKKIELAKEREEKYLVNSTKKVKSNVSLSDEGSALKINGTNIDYDKTVQIADSEADENTIATYQYLSTVGKSTSTIYGHMNDTCYKAGSDEFTSSDTKDITGSNFRYCMF